MKTAVCPGSFDPVTLGHIDVFRRATLAFDRVVVLVMQNAAKRPLFSPEERCALIRASAAGIDRLEVDAFSGMTTDYTAASASLFPAVCARHDEYRAAPFCVKSGCFRILSPAGHRRSERAAAKAAGLMT